MTTKIKIKILENLLDEVTKKYDYFIANKEQLYKKTYEMAVKDLLTGVYNRQYLEDYLLKLIKKTKRNNEKIMIIFFDLDGFKPINDNYGHHMGDMVLQEVAKIIRESFREYDLVARFGGDEFVVVIENGNKDAICRRIEILKEKIEDRFRDYSLSISYGIALFPDDITEMSDEEQLIELIEISDEKMYENKRKRKKGR